MTTKTSWIGISLAYVLYTSVAVNCMALPPAWQAGWTEAEIKAHEEEVRQKEIARLQAIEKEKYDAIQAKALRERKEQQAREELHAWLKELAARRAEKRELQAQREAEIAEAREEQERLNQLTPRVISSAEAARAIAAAVALRRVLEAPGYQPQYQPPTGYQPTEAERNAYLAQLEYIRYTESKGLAGKPSGTGGNSVRVGPGSGNIYLTAVEKTGVMWIPDRQTKYAGTELPYGGNSGRTYTEALAAQEAAQKRVDDDAAVRNAEELAAQQAKKAAEQANAAAMQRAQEDFKRNPPKREGGSRAGTIGGKD